MFIERLTLNQPLYSSVHVHHHILSHKSCVVGAAIIVTSHTYVVNKVLISQFLCDKVSMPPRCVTVVHTCLAVSQCLSHQRTPMGSSCLPSGRVSWTIWYLLLISLSAWEVALDHFASKNTFSSSSS